LIAGAQGTGDGDGAVGGVDVADDEDVAAVRAGDEELTVGADLDVCGLVRPVLTADGARAAVGEEVPRRVGERLTPRVSAEAADLVTAGRGRVPTAVLTDEDLIVILRRTAQDNTPVSDRLRRRRRVKVRLTALAVRSG
jgi:hypothetical protein